MHEQWHELYPDGCLTCQAIDDLAAIVESQSPICPWADEAFEEREATLQIRRILQASGIVRE